MLPASQRYCYCQPAAIAASEDMNDDLFAVPGMWRQ
jgi:hypothetical protein